MNNRMPGRSSDSGSRNNRLLFFTDQFSVDEVTRLINRWALAHCDVRAERQHRLETTHSELPQINP